ncbi:MAG TPA: glycosyltransferase family 4 protein [Longimicrobiaceae bacterium]|nr:glycosyltransferase family 4 protein [Longimicrobiaceae bacterium]
MTMHVLHVNVVRDRLNRDGASLLDAWHTLPAIAEAVQGAGARVTVLQAARRAETIHRNGVEYRFVADPRLPGDRFTSGWMPFRLALAAARVGADVIHLNGLGFPAHTRALTALRAPVLAQDHASAPPRRFAALHRWGLASVAGVAFTARQQAEPFLAAGVLRRGVPVFEIPESSTRFTPGDRDAARAVTEVHGDPALLWVGRLNDNKDPLTVLDAVSRAARTLPGLQLWCCFTEAPLLEQVRARIAGDPLLAPRVHLLGKAIHSAVEQMCRAADLFVLGSRREAACFSVLEALACGTAPVLTDIPAFRALTEGGDVGALVPPGDSEAFAAAIVRLAAEPRDVLRARTLAHFRRSLSFEVVGARLVDAYGALLAARRSPRGVRSASMVRE